MLVLQPPRPLPPTVYQATVVDVATVHYPWRQTEQNPTGMVARVIVEVVDERGDVAHVVDAIDVNHSHRMATMFRGCGVAPGDDCLYRLPELVGRTAVISTKNIHVRAGKAAGTTKAVVSGWL